MLRGLMQQVLDTPTQAAAAAGQQQEEGDAGTAAAAADMDVDAPEPAAPMAGTDAAAAVTALATLAASAHRLSDIDVLSLPQDAALPVSGPCIRRHRDCMLLLQQPHPARNTLALAAAADWGLLQERAQTPYAVDVMQAAAGVSCAADAGVLACMQDPDTQDPAAVMAAWANRLALRGEDGLCLEATLADGDEGLDVGLFGREPVNSSYTAEASVGQGAAEVLLHAQLRQALQRGDLLASADGGSSSGGLLAACSQYPRHRLSSLANALLLAGPVPFCLAGGAAAAADRLAALGRICRSEAGRQSVSMASASGRASRRSGGVFEHYLARRLHNLATQPHLLHVLTELVSG